MLSDAQGQPVAKVDELEDEEMKSWNQESDIKFLAEKGSFMKEGSIRRGLLLGNSADPPPNPAAGALNVQRKLFVSLGVLVPSMRQTNKE